MRMNGGAAPSGRPAPRASLVGRIGLAVTTSSSLFPRTDTPFYRCELVI